MVDVNMFVVGKEDGLIETDVEIGLLDGKATFIPLSTSTLQIYNYAAAVIEAR